jgi:hypothetical protein
MRQKRFTLTSCGIFRQAALLAACLVAGAQATTYNINTTNMGLVNDGNCGLREAIDAVNTQSARWGCPGPNGSYDNISLAAGATYTALTGLSLTRSVNILCNTGTCIVDAGNINFDLFTITGGYSPNVYLYRLTLRKTAANTNNFSGVKVLAGSVYMDRNVITGFRIAGLSINAGMVGHTILGSTFSNNGYGLTIGDGTYLYSEGNTISNNGMGIQMGVAALTDSFSVISNNTGAGLFLASGANIELHRTTISGNRNRGIYMNPSSNAHFYYCVFDGNTTSGDGAGIYIPSVQGSTAFAEFYQSTFTNNRAGGNGGGLFVSGTSNLINCTVSTNTAARGGGIYNVLASSNAYLAFYKSTIAFNQATVSGGGVSSVPYVGVDVVGFFASIVGRNSSPTHPDLSGPCKGNQSLFSNLTGATGDFSDDYPPADPLLGPLMDSPGPIRAKYHALLKGSPARDKLYPSGDNFADVRGFPRRLDEKWDVGSYEDGPFETELLTLVSSQGRHDLQDDPSLSNGAGTVMRSAVIGNYVTYGVAVPEGVSGGMPYLIKLGFKSSPDGARVELATAPGTTDFTRIGDVDLYSPTLQPASATLTFNFTQPGIKYFRLKITGKNQNSLGYFCNFDYIKITKQ